MENTEEKNNNPAAGAALEEAVLKYLADNHPDDDQALDEIMQLSKASQTSLLRPCIRDSGIPTMSTPHQPTAISADATKP